MLLNGDLCFGLRSLLWHPRCRSACYLVVRVNVRSFNLLELDLSSHEGDNSKSFFALSTRVFFSWLCSSYFLSAQNETRLDTACRSPDFFFLLLLSIGRSISLLFCDEKELGKVLPFAPNRDLEPRAIMWLLLSHVLHRGNLYKKVNSTAGVVEQESVGSDLVWARTNWSNRCSRLVIAWTSGLVCANLARKGRCYELYVTVKSVVYLILDGRFSSE
jgi:hypothetical protein